MDGVLSYSLPLKELPEKTKLHYQNKNFDVVNAAFDYQYSLHAYVLNDNDIEIYHCPHKFIKMNKSDKYKNIVKAADNMRMLYASHRIQKRDALLPLIKNQLLQLIEDEKTILTEFVKSVGDEIKE